jgi:hypothetical protein
MAVMDSHRAKAHSCTPGSHLLLDPFPTRHAHEPDKDACSNSSACSICSSSTYSQPVRLFSCRQQLVHLEQESARTASFARKGLLLSGSKVARVRSRQRLGLPADGRSGGGVHGSSSKIPLTLCELGSVTSIVQLARHATSSMPLEKSALCRAPSSSPGLPQSPARVVTSPDHTRSCLISALKQLPVFWERYSEASAYLPW